MKKLWIIYDGRATPKEHLSEEAKKLIRKDSRMLKLLIRDTDRCAILETCSSLKEARRSAKDHGDGNCIYVCDIEGKNLVNERFVEVIK